MGQIATFNKCLDQLIHKDRSFIHAQEYRPLALDLRAGAVQQFSLNRNAGFNLKAAQQGKMLSPIIKDVGCSSFNLGL
jgi:hypothetical protein